MIPHERAIETLQSDRFDLLVIGGGITGAGVALDAASRGYSVALVEKADFASRTSSRSSKLIHGGLRYLQKLDLGLVREALLERQLLVRLAPHLVRPLPMVVAAFNGTRPDRMTGIGLNMYDVMALANREPTGGYLFYDCQTDDARLVLTVLGEAERFGAICANRLEVVELLGDDGDAGVMVREAETGERFPIRATNVINATGVWADRIRSEELRSEAEVPNIVPSRGTHVTFASVDLPLAAGAIVPAGEGRTIFALPWLGRSLVGTTDNNYDGDIDHVQPSRDDIDYLLEATNGFFATGLDAGDVVGAYAGVRPLISSGDARKSVDISRKAELHETSSGLITITGGKLTTWRRMAKLAVDRLVEREGREAPCHTHEIPLGEPVDPDALRRVQGVADDAYEALAARYGHAAEDVLTMAAEDPALARPIVEGHPDLLAEPPFSARREQARTVADVLLPRTRLGLLAAPDLCAPDSRVPAYVAEALARELGWDSQRVRTELERFAREAAAEGICAA